MKQKFSRAALAALFAAAGIMSAHAQIFEANEGVGTIGEYDATTGALIGTPITGLNTPTGLALAGSNLVVANYNGPTGGNSGSVAEYTTSGQAVSGFSPITGLPQPISVSVSGSDLFVATNGAGNGGAIGEYDARTGAAVNASLIRGLATPVSVLASGSSLYVLTGGSSGSLLRYSLSGSQVGAPTTLASSLSFPSAITLSGGDLFVASAANSGTIAEYTTSGSLVNPSLATGFDSVFASPGGLAVSGNNLYVTNASVTGSVSEFNATTGAAIGTNPLISGLHTPEGIVLVAVPELSSYAMIAFGVGMLLLMPRLRRLT